MTDNNDTLEYLRKVTAALQEAKQRLRKQDEERHEPIAIVSMACRFPGGVESPDDLWRLLDEGRDVITEVPASRWDLGAVFDSNPEAHGRTYARWGGFVGDVDRFDPTFFGINTIEAQSCDPQQRLLLETTWETFERAGLTPADLVGSATGVFVGICGTEYQNDLTRDYQTMDSYTLLGTSHSTVVGRLSYWLGLQGPNLPVDTACSSSLVALHLACQALRTRECSMALAGGVNLLLSPWGYVYFSRIRALSPTGRCHAFSADADGYVRAEGCGMVLLKRLSDAQRAGDDILAVIRGSAVNHDGRSNGFTAPSGPAQEEVIRRALEQARVEAATIDVVECHGTGTPLGDPIEVQALAAVYGQGRPAEHPLVLGSIKTNIGHTEGAAGIAGLMKAVLALRHARIPESLHSARPNPLIPWDELRVRVAEQALAWDRSGHPRRAGVSSFGLSGTNAHVILEEAPSVPPPAERRAREASSYLLPLSAKSPEALEALARSYGEHLAVAADDAALSDISYTASVRRAHYEYRLAVVGRTREEMAGALSSSARDGAASGIAPGQAAMPSRQKVVFVFPGQGSQWLGMGRQLLAEEPAFRNAIEACDQALTREAGFSVLDQLAADEAQSRLTEIDVVQPLLFAVEVALAALWRSWGVAPDAVIGHSMGEIAAAHVAGILTIEDAAKVICRRSRLLRRVSGKGAMGLVELTLEEAEAALSGHEDRLSVAVSNGPRSTVLSGDPEALEEVLATLEKRGVFCRRVKVDVASHSPQMDPLRGELLAALGDVRPRVGELAMRSTVTGEAVSGPDLDANYWVNNLRAPVLFSSVTQRLIDEEHLLFVEMSPHPILLPAVEENLREKKREGTSIASLRRNTDERRSMLEALGALYARGVDPSFARLFPSGGRVVSLPTYPWQRERYWIEAEAQAGEGRRARTTRGGHPLLGTGFRPADLPEAHYWEQWVSAASPAYMADHQVQGRAVFPGAGYVEMALAAAREVYGEGRLVIEALSFEWMLALGESHERRVQASLMEERGHRASLTVSSRDEETGEWVRHVRATVREGGEEPAQLSEPPRFMLERCPTEISGTSHYARANARQIHYGPAFQGVERIWVGTDEALGRVRLPEAAGDPSAYHVHPALLDACFQVCMALIGEGEGTFVPVEIAHFQVHQRSWREAWVRATPSVASPGAHGRMAVDLAVVDDGGHLLLEVVGLQVQRLAHAVAADPYAGCAYTVVWRPKPLAAAGGSDVPTSARAPGTTTWLVFADAGRTGAAVAEDLRARGDRCIQVVTGPLFERRGPDSYAIDPSKHEDYQRLFREVVGADAKFRGVVHCWNLDATPWEGTTAETLLADVRRGSVSVLHVVQELAWQSFRDAPRLFVVTRRAQAVGEFASELAVAQAALWGLGRTIAMEQPDLACTRVDLDPTPGPHDAALLIQDILAGDGEDQIAWREGKRLVARLERGDLEPAEAPTFDVEGSYLITGGLGGLGLSVARWLVASGARHILLLGRNDPSDQAREAIHAMTEAGAEVRTWRADVARAADVERALAHLNENMPQLRGIIHAAGVLEDRTLQEMGEEQFVRALRPKILGGWNLHAATRGIPLDFFVMYSSAAGLLGSPGQGNYAAANAFLDALAHARAAEGLPAMSIQWGTFSKVGLAVAEENRGQRLAHRGIDSFTPEEGTAILSRLIRHPWGEIGVLRMSVRQWIEFYPRAASAPFLSRLRKAEERARGPQPASRFVDALRGMSSAERRPALERHVMECLGRVLRLPPERIQVLAPFRGYGIDSLMSLEIRNRLEASLGLRLSAALLFTYPTTAALVDHLLGELRLEAVEMDESIRTLDEAEAQALSEEVAVAMLDARLSDLEDLLK
jgi:myxalamid-type polyketide synthase MxaE and MxaD